MCVRVVYTVPVAMYTTIEIICTYLFLGIEWVVETLLDGIEWQPMIINCCGYVCACLYVMCDVM